MNSPPLLNDAAAVYRRLLDKSADDQQEVTDQLGYQVRKAVEVLIQALDKADQERQQGGDAKPDAMNEPKPLIEANPSVPQSFSTLVQRLLAKTAEATV